MQIPIGVSDFKKLISYRDPETRESYTYIDKSLFIKEIISNGSEVLLFTRPRRFGKTLNLSLLRYFFANEVNGEPTKDLFNGLKISECPNYMLYQGKYPVIFISFKDIKAKDFTSCMEQISDLIRDTYKEQEAVITLANLAEDDLLYVNKILKLEFKQSYLQNSLKNLIRILYNYYKEKPILLIDEYDTPLHNAYIHGYYGKLIEFLRNLFSAALRDNERLHKAILTGILRVSKESIFSGLSHVEIYSLLDEPYNQYFGFTEEETTSLLEQASLKHNLAQIKSWYNGYNFGGLTIYNPWSILQCIKRQGEIRPYWINTSGNALVKKLIINSPLDVKEDIQKLMKGETIKAFVNEHTVFADLKDNPASVWSLLLLSGYLKYVTADIEDIGYNCELTLPNREINTVYKFIIKQWLSKKCGSTWQVDFLTALLAGNVLTIEEKLKTLILETVSYYDVSKKAGESFYHGLMLGFISGLKDNYIIHSNKESGLGRYDMALIPKETNQPGVIIEVKVLGDTHKITKAKLMSTAKDALKQIRTSKYTTDLKAFGVKKIHTLGIAFSGKDLKVIGN